MVNFNTNFTMYKALIVIVAHGMEFRRPSGSGKWLGKVERSIIVRGAAERGMTERGMADGRPDPSAQPIVKRHRLPALAAATKVVLWLPPAMLVPSIFSRNQFNSVPSPAS